MTSRPPQDPDRTRRRGLPYRVTSPCVPGPIRRPDAKRSTFSLAICIGVSVARSIGRETGSNVSRCAPSVGAAVAVTRRVGVEGAATFAPSLLSDLGFTLLLLRSPLDQRWAGACPRDQ